MQFLGSLTPCLAPDRSCHRLTFMDIVVIACDHVLYVVVVAFCAFVDGSGVVWGSAMDFVVGYLGVLGRWSASCMCGEATLTSVGRCPSEGDL